MKIPATFEDLVKEAQSADLYSKLIKQLNKDFLYANIDLDFDEEILPSSLKYILHETLFNLIQDKFSDYLNLLYIIDVSESKIRALDGSDVLKLSDQVTLLILQREWQKVWYKNKYKT
ncbi:MAG: hypothetical protein EX263_05730 [Flavobacteriaceae bacterium]|nr:MAG: hypothetical protein EX263_05730 [Flavobacteriaceae bacterium]